jgi:hypothetical protein
VDEGRGVVPERLELTMAMPRRTRFRWRLTAVPLTVLASTVASSSPTVVSATPVRSVARGATSVRAPVPVTPDFPATIDPIPDYESEDGCDPDAKPGTRGLEALLRATYGNSIVTGIVRACGQGGRSGHKQGRALDWMISARDPGQATTARNFLGWLLGTDSHGNRYAMARRLGVMYVIWDSRKFYLWNGAVGWTEYSDCLRNRVQSRYDTTCHRDHIHLSLTWRGANQQSSWWTQPATPPTCASPAVSREARLVPEHRGWRRASTTVFQNTTAIGTPGNHPCRVPARGRVSVWVAGGGGLPAGIAEAEVEVRAAGARGTTWVGFSQENLVRRAGSASRLTKLAVTRGRSATTRWTVALGASGRFDVLTGPARTDLQIRVLGYRLVDQQADPEWMRGAPGGVADRG